MSNRERNLVALAVVAGWMVGMCEGVALVWWGLR